MLAFIVLLYVHCDLKPCRKNKTKQKQHKYEGSVFVLVTLFVTFSMILRLCDLSH